MRVKDWDDRALAYLALPRSKSHTLIHSHSSFLLLHDIIYFLYVGLINKNSTLWSGDL
jgi:hypothetical protein